MSHGEVNLVRIGLFLGHLDGDRGGGDVEVTVAVPVGDVVVARQVLTLSAAMLG